MKLSIITVASAAALLLTMWFANQGGIAAQAPAKFAATIYLAIEGLLVVGFMWLGAAGWGWPLRRWLLDDSRFAALGQVALGMAVMLIGGWLLAWTGWLNALSAMTLWSGGVVLWAAQLAKNAKLWMADDDRPREFPWSIILLMPAVGLLLVAASCPPGTLWRVEAFGYDVLTYHLQIPRQWIEAGGMVPLEHNVYTYLPGLVESAYMQIAVMRGSINASIYACQLFSASLAVFGATVIAATVASCSNKPLSFFSAALFLSVPWIMITGSIAYDETAAMAFGATAVLIFFETSKPTWHRAAAIGLLLGAATLAKLTAGPMIALPVGLLMLFGVQSNYAQQECRFWRWSRRLRAPAVAAFVGLLTLSPYLSRNAAWTGNPIFPFATTWLGRGHWNEELSSRFTRSHGLEWGQHDRAEAMWRQWIGNSGYGAWGGHATPREVRNVARFTQEGGVPVLWLGVGAAVVAILGLGTMGRQCAMLLGMLAVQLVFWLTATHLQSRFLIPTLLPGCLLLGLGMQTLQSRLRQRMASVMPIVGTGLVAILATTSLGVLWQQTRTARVDGQVVNVPLYFLVDELDQAGAHLIDKLPTNSKTLLVADYSAILYIDRPVVYHTAFDASLLGQISRRNGGRPDKINAALRNEGITHVWVGWSELKRLHTTYGYDPDVTVATLRKMIDSGWVAVDSKRLVPALYALPPE